MVVLKTGSVVVLPDHESGKVVMYLDRSKLLTSPSALWTPGCDVCSTSSVLSENVEPNRMAL
jgi:hypothetical protein